MQIKNLLTGCLLLFSYSLQAQTNEARVVVQTGHNSSGAQAGSVFSPDSKYILTYDAGGTYIIWEIATGREIRKIGSNSMSLVSGFERQSARFISQPAISPGNKYLVAQSSPPYFNIWDLSTGKIAGTIGNHQKKCIQSKFSADGKQVFYLSVENGVTFHLGVYDISSKSDEEILVFTGNIRSDVTNPYMNDAKNAFSLPSCFALTENKELLAIGMQDGRCLLADINALKKKRNAVSMKDMENIFVDTVLVKKLFFSENNTKILAYTNTGIAWYDTKKGKKLNGIIIPPHKELKLNSTDGSPNLGTHWEDSHENSSKLSEDGGLLSIYRKDDADKEGTIMLYRLPSFTVFNQFSDRSSVYWGDPAPASPGDPVPIQNVSAISNDGKYFADIRPEYVFSTTGVLVQTFTPKTIVLASAGFSPDSNGIYFALPFNDAFIFNGATGSMEKLRQFIMRADTVSKGNKNYSEIISEYIFTNNIVISPDGKTALTWPLDFSFSEPSFIWDWQKRQTIGKIDETYNMWKISPDGNYAVANKIIDVRNKTVLPIEGVNAFFSKNGKSIFRIIGVSAGGQQKLRLDIIEIPSGRLINTIALQTTDKIPEKIRYTSSEPADDYYFGEFSANGKEIYSTIKGTIVFWDVNTGKETRRIKPEGFRGLFAVSGNQQLMAYAGEENEIYIGDFATGRILKKLIAHSAGVNSLAFSSDNKRLISCSADRRSLIWDVSSGEELISFAAYSPKDYIIKTPDNYYMATRKGAQALHFIKNNKSYLFDQFDLQYNRPDKVLEKLGLSNPAIIGLYKKAYEKRLQVMGFNPANFETGHQFNVPELVVTNLNDIPKKTGDKMLTVQVKANDQLFNLDRLNILINGVQQYGAKGLSLRKSNSKEVNVPVKIELSQGRNIIDISVMNEKGIESLAEKIEIGYTATPQKPNLYIVSIGVGKYVHPNMNLSYASKDAKDIAAIFGSNPMYGKVRQFILPDEKANTPAVKNLKKELLNSGVDDHVIIFYSGHGVYSSSLDYYLGTSNISFTNPAENGLMYTELENLLDSIPARNKALLVDACNSGEIDKGSAKGEVNEVKLAGFVRFTKSGGPGIVPNRLGSDNSFEMMKQLFTDLRKSTGATVIAAAAGGQYAFEGQQWKNGVFTYCLINGIRNRKADLNNDGKIMLSELQDYVSSTVFSLTGGKQMPVLRTENLVNDFRIR